MSTAFRVLPTISQNEANKGTPWTVARAVVSEPSQSVRTPSFLTPATCSIRLPMGLDIVFSSRAPSLLTGVVMIGLSPRARSVSRETRAARLPCALVRPIPKYQLNPRSCPLPGPIPQVTQASLRGHPLVSWRGLHIVTSTSHAQVNSDLRVYGRLRGVLRGVLLG
jgi:hypothetical protein